jgi:hypothetical protein
LWGTHSRGLRSTQACAESEDGAAVVAGRRVAGTAARTVTAPCDAGHHHSVADSDRIHGVAELDDGPDRFVTDRQTVDCRQVSIEEVQIGSADCSGRDCDDRALGARKRGVGHRLDPNLAAAVHDDRAHCASSV